jgi:hypothetical protein
LFFQKRVASPFNFLIWEAHSVPFFSFSLSSSIILFILTPSSSNLAISSLPLAISSLPLAISSLPLAISSLPLAISSSNLAISYLKPHLNSVFAIFFETNPNLKSFFCVYPTIIINITLS